MRADSSATSFIPYNRNRCELSALLSDETGVEDSGNAQMDIPEVTVLEMKTCFIWLQR